MDEYKRRFNGKDFYTKILKGRDNLGNPASWVEGMLQDIKEDKALVLQAGGLKVGEVGASYMVEVRVFCPKLPDKLWKNHKILKYYKELTKEDLFNE